MAEIFFYLTTTGRKTGKPHKIEIWFVEHKSCYFLCSGGGTGAGDPRRRRAGAVCRAMRGGAKSLFN